MRFSASGFGLLFLLLITSISTCSKELPHPVRSGAEVLIDQHLPGLAGKRVGILLNQSSTVRPEANSPLTLDTLLTLGVDIRALFAPEHGVRGDIEAGGSVKDGVDSKTGIPIYSLYGSSKQPPNEVLEGLDIILFDIQDVGARFYTYMSTMGLLLDVALPAGVEVWILDRPNPAGGEYISGWMLNPEFTSFVGLYPVPMVHGMTLGELALMMVGEGWVGRSKVISNAENSSNSESTVSNTLLKVIPMEEWNRTMLWPDTGREWVPPSPNLPTFEHAYVYLGTCLVEGTTLSEGRGTEDPFLLIGSSTFNPSQDTFDSISQSEVTLPTLPGAQLTLTEFIPKRIPGKAESPKYQDQIVHGIRITLTDASLYQPVESGLELLRWLLSNDPEAKTTRFLTLLAGDDTIGEILSEGQYEGDISQGRRPLPDFSHEDFRALREPYLLY